MTDPLTSDPSRQAVAPLRGYRYQILRSIYEWIELSDREVLYIEGAEDVDRVTESGADTFQIKDTKGSGSITLRSEPTREAINNYWKVRKANPGRPIRFHLITTSEVGIEQGSPFGADRPGLVVWHRATSTPDIATAERLASEVAEFLRRERNLEEDVLRFLETATPREILDRLVRPIAWHTCEPSGKEVEGAALRKLQSLCWDRNLPLAYASKVLLRLERDVWATATSHGTRALTVEDFRLAFDQETVVPIPHSDLMRLVRGASIESLSGVPPSGESVQALEVLGAASRIDQPPPIPDSVMRRSSIENSLRAAIAESGCVHIHGATGTGKTTHAALLTGGFKNEWLWVSCRGADETQVRIAIAAAGRWLDRNQHHKQIIFDDVDFEPHLAPMEASLPGLLYTLRSRGGALVITAHREMPQRLRLSLGLNDQSCYSMPYFSEEEVDEYLQKRGCADNQLRASWTKVIFLRTRGHPQLVVAQTSALSQASFPKPSLDDLIEKPSVVREAKEEARLLLANSLPPAQRDLLYRLSLLAGRFTRSRAITVGDIAVAIPSPGDAFDRLVGPWVEKTSDSEYLVSPLIQGAGQAANGEQWAKGMHASIASAWVRFTDQTPWTISSILIHAVLGNNGKAIVTLFAGLQNADNKIWDALATADAVFTYVYTNEGQSFPAWKPFEVFCARMIQLRFAARSRPELCIRLYDRIDEEFPSGAKHPITGLMRQMLLAQIGLHAAIPLPLDRVVDALTEVVEIAESLPAEIQEKKLEIESPDEISTREGSFDTASIIGVAIVQRTKSIEDLKQAIGLLNRMEPRLRYRSLQLFDLYPDMARQLADAVWLSEHQSSSPRWSELADALGSLYDHAITWNRIPLAQGVASVRARLLHENLQRTEAALQVLTNALAVSDESYLLLDAKAKILLDLGRPEDALQVWKEILPCWEKDANLNTVSLALAYRNAAIAAARSENWTDAAIFFSMAASVAFNSVDSRLATGLLADAAHASWRANLREQSINLFCQSLVRLEQVTNSPEDLRDYYLHKIIGHVLSWTVQAAKGKGVTLEPPIPGCCSHMEPQREIATLNTTPIDFSWSSALVITDSSTQIHPELEHRLSHLRNSVYPGVRMTVAHYEIDRSLAKGEVLELVRKILALRESLNSLRRQEASGGKLWESTLPSTDGEELIADVNDDFAKLYLCKGLLVLTSKAAPLTDAVAAWTSDAERLGLKGLKEWLNAVALTVESNQKECLDVLRTSDVHWARRIVASAVLLVRGNATPFGILYAHVTLFMLHGSQLSAQVENEACMAITTAWRAATQNRAFLKVPNLTVPRILEACNEAGNSWGKMARIMLAAYEAVDIKLPSNIIENIRFLAREGSV